MSTEDPKATMIEENVADKHPEIPIDLVDRIANAQCVLFVGPVASLPPPGCVGPPGPALLTVELIDRLSYVPDYITLPWVAQLYQQQAGAQDLSSLVSDLHRNVEFRPTTMHYSIVGIPQFRFIVSTAYDELLDGLCARSRPARRRVLKHEDLESIHEPHLIKLFGVASQPSTLCVTEENLERLFRQQQQQDIFAFLRYFCAAQPLLFVGYQLADPTFRRLLWELRLQASPTSAVAYIVHPDPGLLETKYLRQHSLVPIVADANVFLKQLQQELSMRAAGSVAVTVPPDTPIRLSKDVLRGRSEQVNRVLKLMGLGGTVESNLAFSAGSQHADLIRQLIEEYDVSLRDDQPLAAEDSQIKMNQAQIYLQYAFAEWADHDYRSSRKHFEDAIRLAPDRAEAVRGLHYLLAEMGELDDSLTLYRRATELEPEVALVPPQYKVLAVLGTSGLGISYQVREEGSDSLFSLKVFKNAIGQDDQKLNLLKNSLQKLQHPGIPQIAQLERYRGRCYMLNSFRVGTTLETRLRDNPPSVTDAFSVLDKIAEILAYAHASGQPHLSLEPAAVLIDEDNNVSLLHFGEAQLVNGMQQVAKAARQIDDYQSPEQRAGFPADARSDIYALGTIAYQMFTGRLPGVGAYESPSAVNPRIDEAVDVLIASARAIDPARRFSTMDEMRREIQRITQINQPGGLGQTARWILFQASRAIEWMLQRPARWGTCVALVLLAFLAEFWLVVPQALGATRLLLMLALSAIPASYLSYWWVRERARTDGLGSLIHSGRGMGFVFGLLLIVWHLRTVTYQGQHPDLSRILPGFDFLGFLGTSSLVTLGVTFIMLLMVNVAASASRRYLKRYTAGFYGMFVLLCVLVAVAAWLRWGGIIEILGY